MQNRKVEKILFVEDEKNIQTELEEYLQQHCYQLLLADDGFQGLELYREHQPDIVISDIRMPLMNGIEMCKEIRKINTKVPVVFTTAFSDVQFFQQAIELQVAGYILKPIDLDQLDQKLSDVIDQVLLGYELRDKENMLLQSAKLASMGEMIGNIAHQWKQPLSVISIDVNNIKMDCELGDVEVTRLQKYADHIGEQVSYLAKTIDDFRGFFKPTNTSATYNVKEFIDKCIVLVKASFDENTIKAIQEIDDNINSYGDPYQLTQALINILNNAKDALKQAEGLRKKLVFIVTASADDNNNLVITIKDNAGGIPSSALPHVFEPYFTTKEHLGGSGLGLYISHTIITRNLKGSIRAENDVFEHEGNTYKGAKFVIKLPKLNN